MREYKAMHEETFPRSWLTEEVEGREKKEGHRIDAEVVKERWRERERG